MSSPEFNTREFANASERAKNFKVVTTDFPATNFPIGINMLDIQHKCNPRIRAYADNIAPADSNYDRFIGRINLDTWGDTRLINAGCTWLDTSKHSLDFQFGRFSSGKMNGADTTKLKMTDIQFNRPYRVPPKVVLWLTAFESDCSKITRLQLTAENVTNTGFKLQVFTWLNSVVDDAAVSWIAVPSDNAIMTAGQVMSTPSGPATGFQQQIKFERPFKNVPRVMVALNKIDVANNANLRITAYPKDITNEGMTLVLETWGGTTIYSCAMGYIAIEDISASSKNNFNLVGIVTTNDDIGGFSVVSRELKVAEFLTRFKGALEVIINE